MTWHCSLIAAEGVVGGGCVKSLTLEGFEVGCLGVFVVLDNFCGGENIVVIVGWEVLDIVG